MEKKRYKLWKKELSPKLGSYELVDAVAMRFGTSGQVPMTLLLLKMLFEIF